MNDLEERLRADFELATADIDYAINPDDVLQAGRIARRRRALGRVAAVAAAVVGLFGVSVYVAPPLIAQILDHQTMEVDSQFQWDKTRSEFDQLSVKLERKDDVVTATATGSRDGAVVATRSWTVPSDLSPTRMALGRRAVIAILPGEVEQVALMQGMGGSGGSHQWMSSFGVTLVATQLQSALPEPQTLDWVWLDASGDVRSIDGTPAVKFAFGGETYVVFKSQRMNEVGLVGHFAFQLSDVTDDSMLDGAVSWGGTDAVSWQLGVLPAGAHDVQPKLSKPDGDWAGVALSDGTVVVLARVPGEPKQVVTSLSYVRADGTLVKVHR
ncbi:MAG: hypothetical protein CVT62_13160 [Actinobacteria bacterium HGW-Actinobacteria-2]|nr:MAG: hypothetical protein CVT62_13160 [Actinobacteria bacterium HGW-Actinobacteria-2]